MKSKNIFLKALFASLCMCATLCMVKETNVKEPLSAQQKLKKFLVEKDGKPIDPTSKDYPVALDQFANTIVKRIKVLQEIKQKGQTKKKEYEEKKEIQQEPFTQTIAHLNPEHKKNFNYDQEIIRICKLFMRKEDPKNPDNYIIEEPSEYEKQLFKNIIINEQKHSDYYVFYQGASGYKDEKAGPGILTDVYTEIARWLDINEYSKSMMLRIFLSNEPFSSVKDFFDDESIKRRSISDTGFDVRAGTDLLATNISLFGRMTESDKSTCLIKNTEGKWQSSRIGDEFSLSYFFKNKSNPLNVNRWIKNTFEYFGFESSYIKDIFDNYKKYMENAGGNLLQIFVRKDIVDSVAYLSIWQGRPLRDKLRWDNPTDRYSIKQYFDLEGSFDTLFEKINEIKLQDISVILENYINNPDFIHYYSKSYIQYKDCVTGKTLGLVPWFDTIQARIIMIPSFFSDESKMKVFRYYSEKQIDEAAYKKGLSVIFEKIIKDWVIRQLKMGSTKDFQSNNLSKLLDFLIANPEEKK